MQSNDPVDTSTTKTRNIHSTLVSKNITICGHRTSVRLEPEMWQGLTEVCRREHASLHEVCTAVAQYKAESTSLTAAIRVFIMAYFRTAATEEGHMKAGHGQKLLQSIAAPGMQAIIAPSATSPQAASPHMATRYMMDMPPRGAKLVSF